MGEAPPELPPPLLSPEVDVGVVLDGWAPPPPLLADAGGFDGLGVLDPEFHSNRSSGACDKKKRTIMSALL